MRYISKGDWFKEGTEARLIDDYRPDGLDTGLFEGIRVCVNPNSEGKSKSVGEEYLDQEICFFDEFEVVDED
jgi:hypothetical protein